MKESKEQVPHPTLGTVTLFKCSLGDCYGYAQTNDPVEHDCLRQRVRKLYEEGLVQEDVFLSILDSRIQNRPGWLNNEERREFARKVIQDAVNKIKKTYPRKY